MNKIWLTLMVALVPISAFSAAGDVGIGTSTPSKKLHITGQATNLLDLEGTSSSRDAMSNGIVHISDGGSGNHYGLYITSKGSGTNNALYASSTGSGTNYAALFPAGKVGVGLSNPSYPLHVQTTSPIVSIYGYGASAAAIHGSNNIGGSAGYGVWGTAGSYWGAIGRADGYAFVGVGAVWSNGAGYFNQSDGRLKERVENLTRSMETLMKLRPVSYQWKPNSEAYKATGAARQYGLIAQEVKEVIPEIVLFNEKAPFSPGKDGKKSLDEELGGSYGVEYGKVIPFLIGGLQEIWGQLKSFIEEQGKFNDDVRRRFASVKQSAQQLDADSAALKSLLCQGAPAAKHCAGKGSYE